MKPVELLQGKWLGHPLHPAVVHLPVGAWIAAAIVDLVERDAVTAKPAVYAALYCVVAGLAGALIAVPTGVAEWSSIKKEKPAWKLGLYHMAFNLLAAVIWAANLGLRVNALHTGHPVTVAILSTSIAGAGLVIVGGYLGSLMVFDHGTSVARLSKKKWRRRAEQAGANVPEAR